MKQTYYVEITISGSLAIESVSGDEAIQQVKDAIAGTRYDEDILDGIINMAHQHLEAGDIDVGDVFVDENCIENTGTEDEEGEILDEIINQRLEEGCVDMGKAISACLRGEEYEV